MTLLSAHQASKQLGVSSRTLRRWHAQGLIKAERTYSGICLYDINHVLSSPTLISFAPTASLAPTEQPFKYIYARVSSPKQRSDLERQKQHLQQLYPSHLILTDIASGINWKRPGLKTLLECSSRGLVTEVGFIFLFFSLCQGLLKSLALCTGCGCPQRPTLLFAFDLIEHIFRLNGTKIIVVHSDDNTSSSISAAEELAQDILAINTVFICRMQGRRSAENRKRRRNGQGTGWREETQSRSNAQLHSEETEDRGIDEELEGASLPECKAEGLDEEMDGVC